MRLTAGVDRSPEEAKSEIPAFVVPIRTDLCYNRTWPGMTLASKGEKEWPNTLP